MNTGHHGDECLIDNVTVVGSTPTRDNNNAKIIIISPLSYTKCGVQLRHLTRNVP